MKAKKPLSLISCFLLFFAMLFAQTPSIIQSSSNAGYTDLYTWYNGNTSSTWINTESIKERLKTVSMDMLMQNEVKHVEVVTSAEPCLNLDRLKNICMNIDARNKDPNPKGDYIYLYQRKILDAACVDVEKDSEEVIGEKVRKMWDAAVAQDKLNCRSIDFDANGGNVIKFAVSTKFNEFLDDMVYWGVNLNQIDKVDNRTVLDYVQHEINVNKGMSIEVKLKHYYKILRDAGAKHRSEL